MSLIHDLIPHMRRVLAAERDLRELGLLWQMIESTAAIACPEEADSILGVITQTRHRFESLQARLVEQLGKEVLAELQDELASAAQCTIDILVRNLFERTADVGFLATDDALRALCLAAPEDRPSGAAALARRLVAYRDKYSVYDDIVLLAPDGAVLARADEAACLPASRDAHLAEAQRAAGYVEWFGCSDLGAEPGVPTLFYAHRVEDAATGRCIGVLVLRFRHSDEMARIFDSVADRRRQAALVLVDANDRVIASSDDAHVPLGARVACAPGGEVQLTHFAGREYLSVTRASPGYQGYHGPVGWRAHAMVSLLTAFSGRQADEAGADGGVALDNAELGRIQAEVDAINGELRRVVWNGRLVARSRPGLQSTLKAVLRQVHETGARTRARVAAAITDLCGTSLARQDHQAHELARLAADIMDRNLYERANDCRWWALSPAIAEGLSGDGPTHAQGLQRVLAHVNGLYTVYARLVVFDAGGRIRGVSNDPADGSLLGGMVEAAWTEAVRGLTDAQRYAVTPFTAGPLTDGLPTYVYLAAVRDPVTQALLGGVATVFHAQREFRAMLDDVLGTRDGVAAFVGADGRVLACTDERWPTGAEWPFGGQGRVTVLGVHYAVSGVAAAGYREFKRSDGYDNQVRAIVALRLGAAERRRTALTDRPPRALPRTGAEPAREFALFTVGAGHYALAAPEVLEARPCTGWVGLPTASDAGRPLEGLLEVPDGAGGSCVVPVLGARRLLGVEHAARQGDGVVIVLADAPGSLRPGLGLRVDAVDTVLDIGPEHQQPPEATLRSCAPHWGGLLKVGAGGDRTDNNLVLCLDANALRRLAMDRAAVG
ncbi:MAG: chemotaxis protein CheW [Burkholderiales bacterium]|nr:chemotaxis protein CheW [Burkholderiales bacterium]